MSRAGRPSAIVPDFEGGQQTLFGLARGEIKQSTPKVSARDAGRKAKRDAREKAKKEAAELAEHEDLALPLKKKQATRKIQEAWLKRYTWAVVLMIEGKEHLSCVPCRRAQAIDLKAGRRGMGAKPTTNFKKSALDDHDISEEHVKALEICKKADAGGRKAAETACLPDLLEKASTNRLDQSCPVTVTGQE